MKRRNVKSEATDPGLLGLDVEQELFDDLPEETQDANLSAMLAAFKARKSSSPAAGSTRKSPQPSTPFDPVETVMARNPALTREEARADLDLFGG